MTFPRNVGQIPIYYNVKNTGRPYELNGPEQKYRSRYLDVSNTPLYPFGYGLSYTSFKYSNFAIDKTSYAFKAEAGEFKLFVGTNSEEVIETSFMLK